MCIPLSHQFCDDLLSSSRNLIYLEITLNERNKFSSREIKQRRSKKKFEKTRRVKGTLMDPSLPCLLLAKEFTLKQRNKNPG